MPASKPKTPSPIFFLSYSRKDSEFARKLSADLQSSNFEVWLDQSNLEFGEPFYEQIKIAIEKADYLLVLMSTESLKSDWIRREVELALGRGKGLIVPVLIDRDAIPLIPMHLRSIQWLDLSDPSSYNNELHRFVQQIEARDQERQTEAETRRRSQEPEPLPTSLTDILNTDEFAKRVAREVAVLIQTKRSDEPAPLRPNVETESNLVFVIMAFSEDMDPIFDGIQAAAHSSGFKAQRVKDIVGDYRITSKIIESIEEACMVVVDLTHERPNVYFELGYARGVGKTVITTARQGTQVHFDVKDWTCTFYSDSRILERSLKERFLIERERLAHGSP
jgi:hypothetical protein